MTSYDLLKRDIHFYEECRFAYQVIDEAQYIKNHTIVAAKAVKVIKSVHRFALTGTPIENRLSELWSIFDYLMPGFLYSYETFRKELEIPIAKHQDEQALARLQKMTAPFILRRRKEDVLKDLRKNWRKYDMFGWKVNSRSSMTGRLYIYRRCWQSKVGKTSIVRSFSCWQS